MSPRSNLHLARRALLAVAALVLVFATLPRTPAAADDGRVPYDDGAVLTSAAAESGPLPFELAIENFATGTVPVKWAASVGAPTFCTMQANRPANVSAEEFRAAIVAAAEMWNRAGAAIGVDYRGDCTTGTRWLDDNRRNEIGWDDERNEVRAPSVGETHGSWLSGGGRREFTETDIVVENRLSVPEVCLRSIIAHEIGHALGFGHSDSRADLMYPSFNANDLTTCHTEASPAEVAYLLTLYGPNRPPLVSVPEARQVSAGSSVQLTASALDPEGGIVTFTWRQLDGAPVALSVSGASASFTAPGSGQVTLEVSAYDRYLSRGVATVNVAVTSAPSSPPPTPSLQAITSTIARNASLLRYSAPDTADSYRFCTRPLGGETTTCAPQRDSIASVDWSTRLTSGGRAGERTTLALDVRSTALRACNSVGCSSDGVGPVMGGLQWTPWGVDYDVLAMAYDVPAVGIQFTIGGVVNLASSPRSFRVSAWSGAADAPTTLLRDCGNVDPGDSCIGLITPSDRGHGMFVLIESSAPGTPTAVHYVRVR